jgi:nitroreductase
MDLDWLDRLLSRQRAVRHFERRPVDDATIERILRVATYAPSARNVQPWRFIVVRDVEVKRRLGAIFDELGAAMSGGPPDRMPWEDVPVLIAVCSDYAFGRTEAGIAALGASIYPAVQNLLLAAHAAGLGTVMTTRWKARESEVQDALGLPDSMTVHAIVPLGWPDRHYGKGRRRPVRDVTYRERFGQPW